MKASAQGIDGPPKYHVHVVWQDRRTMRGALSVLCQGGDRPGKNPTVTENGLYVIYTPSMASACSSERTRAYIFIDVSRL